MRPHRLRISTLLIAAALPLALAAAAPAASEPGIYLEDATAKTETAVAGSITMDFKGRNVGASMVSFGLIKPKTVFTYEGARADLRLPAQPTFRFHFGPKLDARAMQDPTVAMKLMSGEGMPMNAGKPEDFVLVALNVQGEGREIVLKADRHGRPEPTNSSFSFTVEKLGEGDFRVRPRAPLPRGEYGFFCGAEGSMPEIWAFGVD